EVLPGRTVTWGTGRTGFTIGAANTFIGVDAGSQLTLNGSLANNANSSVKVGPGILETQGTANNANTGGMQILDGTVRLNKQPIAGVTSGFGSFVVGDHVGSDVLEIAQPEQIPDLSAQTVTSSGILRTVLFPSGGAQNEIQNLSVGGAFQVTLNGAS